MTIIVREKGDSFEKPKIDLNGPDGNAYVLLGMAKNLHKQLGKSAEETAKILELMKSSDYENLIKVFDNEFGDFVDLIKTVESN